MFVACRSGYPAAPRFHQHLIRANVRHGGHQPKSVHHTAGDRRHVRRGRLDALARDRGRHGDAGKRRQRLRCRRGDRLHAAGRRAASQRPGRRRAGHRLRRRARQAGGDLRPGSGAGRRHHRALSQRGPRPRARHRAARRLRARHVRRLDADAARLRHAIAARGADAGDRLRAATAIRWSSAPAPPSPPSRSCSAEHWPTSAAVYLPNGNAPTPGTLFAQPGAGGDLCAHAARKPKAPAAIAARRSSARAILVAGFRRRSDRPVLPRRKT